MLHARKFASCNGLTWKPSGSNVVPPTECITNDNMEEFFVQCWDDGSDPYLFISQTSELH